ncbi:hypothetical protein [Georgenia alba]|uniref:Uncharacterized protein n=1 Tax=Georgenia alba TaxID=2233858 RepID=A0ABW2Q807_9MICO
MKSRTRLGATATGAAMLLLLSPGVAQAHPERYDEYYEYFDTGDEWIPWHDTRWVPQGLTKWGEDTLVISYYDMYGEEPSRIGIIDRESGEYVKGFHLDTDGHVGGLAMTEEFFWVSTGGELRRYERTDLSVQQSGSTLEAEEAVDVEASSYAYAEGENVWVGNYNADDWDYMYRYAVDEEGGLTHQETVLTPSAIQGVVVTDDTIVWSQSEGRTNDSYIMSWPRGVEYNRDWDIGNAVVSPNMSEGMVIAGGELQVVYESGSDAYNGGDGEAADYIIRSVHHGQIPTLP